MSTSLGVSSPLAYSSSIDAVSHILACTQEYGIGLFVILFNGFIKALSGLAKHAIIIVILLESLALLVLVYVRDRLD